MTVALYISPKSALMPIMLSDTLLSDEAGNPIGLLAMRHREFPSGAWVDLSSLARKNILHGDRTAIAFAGSVELIREFVETSPTLIDDDAERPIKVLGDRANMYAASGPLRVLALHRMKNAPGLHHVKPNPALREEIDGLGYFAVVGSGSEDVVKRLRSLAGTPHVQGQHEVMAAFNRVLELCITSLCNEVYRRGQETDYTWGGLLEWVFFDPKENRWKRQPSTAYFLYQSTFDKRTGDFNPPRLIDRQFMYEPGDLDGWILAIKRAADTRYNISYRLTSIDEKDHSDSPPSWMDWTPGLVGLAMECGVIELDGSWGASVTMTGGYHVNDDDSVSVIESDVGPYFAPYGAQVESFLSDRFKEFKALIGLGALT